MILNNKIDEDAPPRSIKIGNDTVMQEKSAKLLGVMLDDNQQWSSQIKGVGGTINSLSSRLYIIKRLSNVLSKDRVKRIYDSLYTSKLRYGLQLFGKVRYNGEDSQDGLLKSLQITQNKSARFLNGNTLEDKVCTSKIFKDLNLLSVNQLNAQIKIREVWKSLKNENYPKKWEYVLPNPNVNSRLRSGDKKS